MDPEAARAAIAAYPPVLVDPMSNPYWQRVLEWAPTTIWGQATLGWRYDAYDLPYPVGHHVGGLAERLLLQQECVRQYAYTITSPDTVQFVLKHCGPGVVDPLAGSGYWADLLARSGGVDVAASDLRPPERTWCTVARSDAVDAVHNAAAARTLLLSWPPLGDPVGARLVEAYRRQPHPTGGRRIVYMGELDGCCGDEDMTAELNRHWRVVARHSPPVWRSASQDCEDEDVLVFDLT